MDSIKLLAKKFPRWLSQLALLALLAGTLWAQAASGSAPSQDQSSQSQTPAGDSTQAAPAAPETTISPKEAKELFRSVDEILEFASHDTNLPATSVRHRGGAGESTEGHESRG